MPRRALQEVEMSAYNRMQAEQRGVTTHGGSTLSSQERQSKVLAAEQRSRCQACGQVGHWQRRGKGFGKKGTWEGSGRKGDGKNSKGNSPKGSPKGSPKKGANLRTVYFSVRDETDDDKVGYMVIKTLRNNGC